jgi:hypothetical protein
MSDTQGHRGVEGNMIVAHTLVDHVVIVTYGSSLEIISEFDIPQAEHLLSIIANAIAVAKYNALETTP